MVDRGRGPLQVKEWSIDSDEGELLLQWFRDPHPSKSWNDSEPGGRLSTVLKLIDRDRYPQTTPDGKHIQEDRIDLYDTLIRIILGAENRNWEDWRGEVSTVEDRWNKEFEDNFTKRGSIYKHLLDYIHEHDEVKSEDFSTEFKEKYFCFFRSMERYWMMRSEKLWFFDTEEGKRLLHWFRESPHSHTWTDSEPDKRFRDVLKLIDDKYIEQIANIQADRKTVAQERKRIREEWRVARINLYNSLFLILWVDKRHGEFDDELTRSESIYKHLLDYIHEYDDVMLKFYYAKNSNNLHGDCLKSNAMYYWFFRSMERYRMCHINPIVYIMQESMEENKTNWEETQPDDIAEKQCAREQVATVLQAATEDFNTKVREAKEDFSTEGMESAIKKFNTEVLETARQEFNTMIDKSGKKSWRYKARMYWLLSHHKNASIGANYKYKTSEYFGPVGVLWRKMIEQENRMLLDEDVKLTKEVDEQFDDDDHKKLKCKGFADKKKYGTKLLDTFDYSSLLAYACAKNDHGLVTLMLESKKEFEADADCDFRWEKAWKETWAEALWHAAYNGRGLIVKKLLLGEWRKLYSTEYYLREQSTQPLHAAVRRGHKSVVEAFCDSTGFNCHEEDKHSNGYTPLEVATVHLKDEPIVKKRIQGILLNVTAVSRRVQESQAQIALTVNSASTVTVGAALIAGVTYAGWLQPPLDYHPYYQFTEPVPDAPDAPLSYMFVQGHTTIRVFAISNAVSFFFAIAAIVAGMETTCFIGELEQMYMTKKNLRNKLKRTRGFFILSVLSVLIAFSSAAIAVLPPIKRFQTDMYVTIALGGFVCMAMLFLFTLSKRRVFYEAKTQFTKHFNTSTASAQSPFLKGLEKIKEKFTYYLEECS